MVIVSMSMYKHDGGLISNLNIKSLILNNKMIEVLFNVPSLSY